MEDIQDSLQNTRAAEKLHKHDLNAAFKKIEKERHPMNYKVPNLGVDQDIKDTQSHTAAAEKRLKHKWTPKQDKNGVWLVPNAKNNNNWTFISFKDSQGLLQLEAESDPICSSSGCPKNKLHAGPTWPMDYPVPNFGADQDVLNVNDSLAASEKIHEKKWNWEDTKKKTPEDPVQYPHDPLDEDVVTTLGHAGQQEAIHGEWVPKKDENGNWILPTPIDNASYNYASNVQLSSAGLL